MSTPWPQLIFWFYVSTYAFYMLGYFLFLSGTCCSYFLSLFMSSHNLLVSPCILFWAVSVLMLIDLAYSYHCLISVTFYKYVSLVDFQVALKFLWPTALGPISLYTSPFAYVKNKTKKNPSLEYFSEWTF